jgi:hypothetical protein
MPPFPVPEVAAPIYLAGDAFDVARGEGHPHAPRYDRIYIGAALPERYIGTFAALLHPLGKLVAPFGDAFRLVSKRADGSLVIDHITSVGYAPLRLPSEGAAAAAAARPRLQFPLPALQIPDDYPSLPLGPRRAVDAILMLQARDGSVSLPGRLPVPLWISIFSFCARDWWMDRSKGQVPWVVQPDKLLEEARASLSQGDALAAKRQFDEADEAYEECLRKLQHLRDEVALLMPEPRSPASSNDNSDDENAASSPKASAAAAAAPAASSPLSTTKGAASAPSPEQAVLSAARELQETCWKHQLAVLRALNRHSRAVRVCRLLQDRYPHDKAVLYAKASALFDDDEVPQAQATLEALVDLLSPEQRAQLEAMEAETKDMERAEAEGATAPLMGTRATSSGSTSSSMEDTAVAAASAAPAASSTSSSAASSPSSAAASAAAGGVAAQGASGSPVRTGPATPPSDVLSEPSVSRIASLRRRVAAGLPAYRRRQRGVNQNFVQFLARLMGAAAAPEAMEGEEGEGEDA